MVQAAPMSRVHHIDLRCEVDPQREAISGEMRLQRGEALSFNGWTEFAGALVSLVSGEADKAGVGSTDRARGEQEKNKNHQGDVR